MRTISSFRSVGALLPPKNTGFPFASVPFGAGKIPPYLPPAVSRDWAFVLSMQEGITLPGNAAPGVTPVGAVWPGQLAKRTDGSTFPVGFAAVIKLGAWGISMLGRALLKSPPYVDASGSNCCRLPPLMYLRHSML